MMESLRALLRRPRFTALAILTLGIGIGAVVAVFSVVNGVILHPFPYRDSNRVVTLWQSNPKVGAAKQEVSPANFLDWRTQSNLFDGMAGIVPWSFDYTESGEPESIRVSLVTEDFFPTLGVSPLIGRILLPEDFREGTNSSVVFSYGLWQRRFGGDRNIIGKKITLDESPRIVVGIMPPQFQFPDKVREIWAPLTMSEEFRSQRNVSYVKVVARLKPNVTVEQAQSQMNVIAKRLSEQYPVNEGVGIAVQSLPDSVIGGVRSAMWIALGAVFFVLLIACANVVNLLLVRGFEREQELAVRSALGAGRFSLMRLMLGESLILGISGGATGLLCSYWVVDLIRGIGPVTLPRLEQVTVDVRVFAFAVAASIISALASGIFPAWFFSNVSPSLSLREGRSVTPGSTRHRIRRALVISEVALALVLLIGAGLLVRSFVNLLRVDPGFNKENLLILQTFVWGGKYRAPEQRAAFFSETMDLIQQSPQVRSASAVSMVPFLGEDSIDIDTTFTIEGQSTTRTGEEPSTYVTVATEKYFATMGIPLRTGRFFDRQNNASASPVVLINETLARRYWPGAEPVGQKINLQYAGPALRTIIGVVGDVHHVRLDAPARPEVYLPHSQYPFGSMTFLVRTNGDPTVALPFVKAQIRRVNPQQVFYNVATMDHLVSITVSERRFQLFLLSSFALLALLLASIGIYGVISYATAQRTHEIGVRMALGAQTSDVLWMVLQEGLRLTLTGVIAGGIAALFLMKLLSAFLFGIGAEDPLTYGLLASFLILISCAACGLPALRAGRIDPAVALRYQ